MSTGEDAATRRSLCAQLETVDVSMFFLLVIIAAVLLSFLSVGIQRKGLCLTIEGETQQAAALPDVWPIRWRSGAMVTGTLGFFLCLAVNAYREAAKQDNCAATKSAGANLLAALFVFLAAVIRLDDLAFIRSGVIQPTADSVLPD